MTSLHRWLSILPLLALSAVPACSSDDAPAAETGNGDEVVDIPNTKVKDQSIGNCWIYATSAWAESLRLNYAGEELNISESYLSYVDWFHGIQDGDFDDKEGLQTGGWFGEAGEYLRRYGVMDEGTFIPEEANAQESSRQSQALKAINASLKNGVLADAAKRKDPNVVRDELDKAFGLNADVIKLLDDTFGHDLARTAVAGATFPKGNKGLRAASDVEVGFYKKAGKEKTITLADAVGEPSYDYSSYGWKSRTGTFAWNETSYSSNPSSQRTLQIRMQKALHGRRPVILVWFVDFNAMERPGGVFRNVPATIGRQGGHMTVMEDYQVSNVAGAPDGVLKAGTVVTDPALLAAALAPTAKIDFLRIKNSWGSAFSPPEAEPALEGGYHDLYAAYLNGDIPVCDNKAPDGKCLSPRTQRGLTGLVLPPDTWQDIGVGPSEPKPEPGTSCGHALCQSGDKLTASCDPCAAQVCAKDAFCCNNEWDGLCVKQVASVCGKTCE